MGHPEVVDLTSPVNVALVRRWKQDDRAYLDILRYVRITSQNPSQLVVGRLGTHQSLKQLTTTASASPGAGVNESQVSNTVQGMDIIP
jgi:translation machinery-associated protein 16